MPESRKESVARLTAILCLACLFCLQGAPAAGQSKDDPIDIEGFIDMLAKGGHDKEELTLMLARRGVRSELNEVLEGDLREAGKDLGEGLDELVEAVRANYVRASVDEPVELRLGVPFELKRFGFRATYVRKDGDDYVVEIERPGAVKKTEETRAGCEHTYAWGAPRFNRQYKLRILSADRQQVRARLQRNLAEPTTLPKEIRIYAAPCLPITLWLVTDNQGSSEPMEPYYISEPLTVGVLRQHVRTINRPIRTPVSDSAKDSDPIKEVYYKDAEDVAMMLGTRPPTLQQFVNALDGGVVSLTSQAELVADVDRSLLVVRQTSNPPASNTKASARLTTDKVPAQNLATGYLRVVRPARLKGKPVTIRQGSQTGP